MVKLAGQVASREVTARLSDWRLARNLRGRNGAFGGTATTRTLLVLLASFQHQLTLKRPQIWLQT